MTEVGDMLSPESHRSRTRLVRRPLKWVPFLMCLLDLGNLSWCGTQRNLVRGLGPSNAECKTLAANHPTGAIKGPRGLDAATTYNPDLFFALFCNGI